MESGGYMMTRRRVVEEEEGKWACDEGGRKEEGK